MVKLRSTFTWLVIVVVNVVALSGICSCSGPASARAVRMDVVRSFYPQATDMFIVQGGLVSRGRSGSPQIWSVSGVSGHLGYWVDSEVVSRSGPFRIRVLLDADSRVKNVTVTSYPGARGREVRAHKFTDQFTGKSPSDPIALGDDIDAISGATISSQVITEGVREIVRLAKRLRDNSAEVRANEGAGDAPNWY